MRTAIIVWIMQLSGMTLVAKSPDGIAEKNSDNFVFIALGYDQFNAGFIDIGLGYHFFPKGWVFAWHGHALVAGYSPWKDLYHFKYQFDITLNGLSSGCHIGNITNGELHTPYFRPFIGYNMMDIVKLNLGYNFFFNEYFRSDLNRWSFSLGLGLPLDKQFYR